MFIELPLLFFMAFFTGYGAVDFVIQVVKWVAR